ncbi:MAG: M16 family metallopeptidase [Paracoccaceae bacterium]
MTPAQPERRPAPSVSALAAAFVTFLASWAAACAARAEAVTSFALANGMQAVVIEDHRAPVVVHMVWYKAGAADETRGVSGVAHFLEHLMFKGTDKVPSGMLSDSVAANGGSDNAFTSYDYTAYYQRIAADRLALVMGMEADRMRNLRLTDEDWRTEREVIIEERAQRTDSDPGALFGEQLRAALFLNHPYGTPTIGWKHEMSALTREDALDWYQSRYAPQNAILIVAGDVLPDDVRALADETYGAIAATGPATDRRRPQEPPPLAPRRLTYADPNVSQPMLVRAWLAPERDPGDQRRAAALTILAELLGGNMQTSVLGRNLVFDRKLALYVSADYDGTSYDDTAFSLGLAPNPGVSLGEGEAALDAAIAAFLDSGVDPAQLDRIKARLRAGIVYGKDSTQYLAMTYGLALTSGLTVADVRAWPDGLQAVTAEDVMAAARDLFDPRRSVTGWLEKSAEGAP